MRLIQFPLGIFGVALATAILPTLSAQAARGHSTSYGRRLASGSQDDFFIILPAMVGLILLRYPIVHLVFEHGSFTQADTLATATALLCYAVGCGPLPGCGSLSPHFIRCRIRGRRRSRRALPSWPIFSCRSG